jgi:hypothetical protein
MLAVSTASAGTVTFSSFGPGDSYVTGSGWSIGGTPSLSQGLQFTPSVSGNLLTVEIAAFRIAGGTSVNVSIMTDSSNQPGTVLEAVQIGPFSTTESIQLANSVAHPSLTAGTKYWAVVTPVNAGDNFGWDRVNAAATNAQRVGSGPWSVTNDYEGTLRVTVGPAASPSAVPALSTWGLALLTILLGALSGRLARKAARKSEGYL